MTCLCLRRRYVVTVTRHGAINGTEYLLPGSESCLNVSMTAVETSSSLLLSVHSQSDVGLKGAGASAWVVGDDSGPEPSSGSVTVINDSPADYYQRSSCCLHLEWTPWHDAETAVAGYSLCFNTTAPPTSTDCLDVGNFTRVLVEGRCACADEAAAPTVPRFAFEFPVDIENVTLVESIKFRVFARNLLGISSSADVTTITVPGLPALRSVAFLEPTRLGRCSDSEAVAEGSAADAAEVSEIFHPAGRQLRLQWQEIPHAAHVRLCGVPSMRHNDVGCVVLPGNASEVRVPAVSAGVYTVSLIAASLAGNETSLSWTVHVDDSPPILGSVHVGADFNAESVSFWGEVDEVLCSWQPASDAETGVLYYEASVERVSLRADTCTRSDPELATALGEPATEADREGNPHYFSRVTCNETNAGVPATLHHGDRYQCVVVAVNHAGLRSIAASNEFVADLSLATGHGLAEIWLVAHNSHEQAEAVSDLEALTVHFSTDLLLDGSQFGNGTVLNSDYDCVSPDEQIVLEALSTYSSTAPAPPASPPAVNSSIFPVILVDVPENSTQNCTLVSYDVPTLADLDLFGFQMLRVANLNDTLYGNSSFAGFVLPMSGQSDADRNNTVSLDTISQDDARVGTPTYQLFGGPNSACCAQDDFVPSRRGTSHDRLLLPSGQLGSFAQSMHAAPGGDALLIATATKLLRMNLTTAEVTHQNATACGALGTIQTEAVAAVGETWAWLRCGQLELYGGGSFAGSTPSAVRTLTGLPASCDTAVGDDVASRLVLIGQDAFVWLRCSSSASLVRVGVGDGSVSTMVSHAARLGACISCLVAESAPTSGPLVAYGRSDADGCTSGGIVELWAPSGSTWSRVSTIVNSGNSFTDSDSSLGTSSSCYFGRVLHLHDGVLYVGVPDANNGAGAVVLYDVTNPTSPVRLCEWSAPPGVVAFGRSVAVRVADQAGADSATGVSRGIGASIVGVGVGSANGNRLWAIAYLFRVTRDSNGAPQCHEGPITAIHGGPSANVLANVSGAGGETAASFNPSLLFSPFGLFAAVEVKSGDQTYTGVSVTAFCPRDSAKVASGGLLPCVADSPSLGTSIVLQRGAPCARRVCVMAVFSPERRLSDA